MEPKVCQAAGGERRKTLKTVYYRLSCLHDNLEATGLRVFAKSERANQGRGQGTRMLLLCFVLILTVKKQWMQCATEIFMILSMILSLLHYASTIFGTGKIDTTTNQ